MKRAFYSPGFGRLVDQVGLVPVLLGGGIPLLPPPAGRAGLVLRKQRVYKKTGIVSLEYDIVRTPATTRRKKR